MTDPRPLDKFDWPFIRWDLARRDHRISWVIRWIDTGRGAPCRIELPMRVGRKHPVS